MRSRLRLEKLLDSATFRHEGRAAGSWILPSCPLITTRHVEMQRLYSGSGSSSPSTSKPKKLRCVSKACDFCHRRSLLCNPSQQAQRCQDCADSDVNLHSSQGLQGREESKASAAHQLRKKNLLVNLQSCCWNLQTVTSIAGGAVPGEHRWNIPKLPIATDLAAEQEAWFCPTWTRFKTL